MDEHKQYLLNQIKERVDDKPCKTVVDSVRDDKVHARLKKNGQPGVKSCNKFTDADQVIHQLVNKSNEELEDFLRELENGMEIYCCYCLPKVITLPTKVEGILGHRVISTGTILTDELRNISPDIQVGHVFASNTEEDGSRDFVLTTEINHNPIGVALNDTRDSEPVEANEIITSFDLIESNIEYEEQNGNEQPARQIEHPQSSSPMAWSHIPRSDRHYCRNCGLFIESILSQYRINGELHDFCNYTCYSEYQARNRPPSMRQFVGESNTEETRHEMARQCNISLQNGAIINYINNSQVTRPCIICGNEFTVEYNGMHFCSDECVRSVRRNESE